MRAAARTLAILIAVLGAAHPVAAGVRYSPAQPDRLAIIEITGSIVEADVGRFEEILEVNKTEAKSFRTVSLPMVFVSLDSPGGNVLAAMKIGRMVRAAFANVSVMPGKRCASACVFILASGGFRSVAETARIGLHRPVFAGAEFGSLPPTQAEDRYNRMLREVRKYLSDMGVSDQLFAAMARVPSQKMKWLSRREIEDYDLDGDDPAIAEWVRASQRNEMGEEWERKFDDHETCLNEGKSLAQCRHLLD